MYICIYIVLEVQPEIFWDPGNTDVGITTDKLMALALPVGLVSSLKSAPLPVLRNSVILVSPFPTFIVSKVQPGSGFEAAEYKSGYEKTPTEFERLWLIHFHWCVIVSIAYQALHIFQNLLCLTIGYLLFNNSDSSF